MRTKKAREKTPRLLQGLAGFLQKKRWAWLSPGTKSIRAWKTKEGGEGVQTRLLSSNFRGRWRPPRCSPMPAGSNLKRSTGTSKTLWRPSSYLLAALKPVYHQLLLSKKGNSKPRSRVASEDLTAAKAARAASSRHCEEPSTTHDGPNDE